MNNHTPAALGNTSAFYCSVNTVHLHHCGICKYAQVCIFSQILRITAGLHSM